MDLPQRKRQRLKDFDYSQNGAYFVTVCTQGKRCLFGYIRQGKLHLNAAGKMVERHLLKMQNAQGVSVEQYKVMPNHIHILLMIQRENSGTHQRSFPAVSSLVQGFKAVTTAEYVRLVKTGKCPVFQSRIWQKSFHDHIVRGEKDFLKIWEYIAYNELKWEQDCFYVQTENPAQSELENLYVKKRNDTEVVPYDIQKIVKVRTK